MVTHGGQTRARSASTASRSLSIVLLAVHLVLFALGGAFLGESSARAAGSRVVVVTATTGGDGTAVVSSTDARLELGTRPRGDRSDRGASGPPLDAVLPRGLPVPGPAAFVGTLAPRSSAHERRPAPSVVHGARGPPAAR